LQGSPHVSELTDQRYLGQTRGGGERSGPYAHCPLHLSSSFFDLAPVVAEAAANLGKEGAYWRDTALTPVDAITGKRPSDWAVVAGDPADLAPLMATGAWVSLAWQRRSSGGPWLWTDRYSSPLAALRSWSGGVGARLTNSVAPD
jgi:hypothetical protein